MRDWRQRKRAFLCGCDDGRPQRMLAAFLDAGSKPEELRLVEPLSGDRGDDLGPALRERPGLVDNQRVDPFHPLQRLGIADQHARLRAAADAHHDRHRRREPQGARAGDDQHRHRRHQAEGETRLGAVERPGREGEQCNADDRRHEPGGHLIGEPLDRRARALRGRDHLHDLGQHRVAATMRSAR
jgi:hypothetical protein